jgi:hypothetical protein
MGTEPAGRPQLDQLGQDGDADLAMGGVTEVEPGGHPHPRQHLLWHTAIGQVAEHGVAATLRGDEADVGRRGPHRLLHRLLVAVALRGDHDGGARIKRVDGEVRSVDQVHLPAHGASQLLERVRHRGTPDDHEARAGHDRLDVHLERAVALARDRYDGDALRHGAQLLRRAQPQEPWLTIGDRPLCLADDGRLGAGSPDPPVDLAGPRDDGARPLVAGRGALAPDHRRQRELLALPGQLRGLLEHVPAVHHSPIPAAPAHRSHRSLISRRTSRGARPTRRGAR